MKKEHKHTPHNQDSATLKTEEKIHMHASYLERKTGYIMCAIAVFGEVVAIGAAMNAKSWALGVVGTAIFVSVFGGGISLVKSSHKRKKKVIEAIGRRIRSANSGKKRRK